MDLDDVWAYLRARGDAGWTTAPSILGIAAHRVLKVLQELGLHMTVFVVGRDTEFDEGRAAVRAFAGAGCEIASHSYEHRGDLGGLPADVIREDLRRAAKAIESMTGQRPVGFRCPSFGISPTLVRVLVEQEYLYDASLLPTVLTPLLRLYQRRTMSKTARAAHPPARMFGSARNVLLPNSPFWWSAPGGRLLEVPVTTFPFLRVPIHMTYLQALAARSMPLAQGYLRMAMRTCRSRGVAPSFLLHPPDVLDDHEVPELKGWPGMSLGSETKQELLREVLIRVSKCFEVAALEEIAQRPYEHPIVNVGR